MTQKLYYADCHTRSFEAEVLSCRETEAGFAVILDQTAFYPEGGGQACDLGRLGASQVLDVQEQGEDVVHFCREALVPGTRVRGEIDYVRRLDLMQQHSGEHIISGLVNRYCGYHNVGFHMGADVITIDYDGVVPPELLEKIEWEANQAVWENLPIRCWYPSPEELPQVPYRSKKVIPWPVRIVEIPGYDICACCGVHTATTGEIGVIKLYSAIRCRGGSRIEMACGGRALKALIGAYDQNRQVSQAFSVRMGETGEAARRMNAALDQEKELAVQLRRQIFDEIAERYVNYGNTLLRQTDLNSVQIRELSDRVAESCGGICAVFCGTDAQGYAYALVTRQGDLRPLGKEMNRVLRGRGGGRPVFQQGRVEASWEEIQSFFAQAWS